MAFTPIVSSQTVTGETVDGAQTISKGGIASSTTIDGGYQTIASGGKAGNTVINSSGWQDVASGGLANSTVINSGGELWVECGGSASVIDQRAGGAIYATTSAKITSGTNTRTDGHSAFSVINGVASNFLLENGGGLEVSSGQSAVNTIITSGGYQYVWGGMANSTAINTSGILYVFDGGTASNTIINDGGNMNLGADWYTEGRGGKANSTTINSGGSQNISSGGTATNTIINEGYQLVYSGGTASNTIVNSGGGMYLCSGGTASGALTIDGGRVIIEYSDDLQPAAMGFKLANAQADDTLLTILSGVVGDISHTAFTLDVNNTATGTYILGSGADLIGMGGAVFTVKDNGQNVNVKVGSSYTFADGDKLSLVLTDAATDQLTADFTAGGLLPAVPAGLKRTVTGSSVLFDWSDAAGATKYDILVDDNADFSSPEFEDLPGPSQASTSLADGTYYWQVQACNAAGRSDWAGGGSFTVGADITPPSVPTGLTQLMVGKKVALDWADSTDAGGIKRYELQGDNQPDLGGQSNDAPLYVTDSKYSITLPDGMIYWHVRAQDNAGNWSDWSETSSFMVDLAPPTVPTGLKVTLEGNTLNYDWNDSTDANGIKQYEIMSDDSDLSNPLGADLITVTESSASIPDTNIGTVYGKVRAQDNSGKWSAWSKPVLLTVTGTLEANGSVSDWVGSTDVYKMTLTNAGTLNLNLTGLRGDANLALFDGKGKQLKISSAKGSAEENISTALFKGDYYVKVIPVGKAADTDYTLTSTFAPCPDDNAGDTSSGANVIGELEDGVAVERNDWTGFGDPADYYQLTLTNAGTLSLNLNLTGLTGDANLTLLDNKGKVLKASSTKGHIDEAIATPLLAGDYFVKIAPADGGNSAVNNTTYTLNNVVDYFPTETAGDLPAQAGSLDLNSSVDEWVGFGDPADYYQLTLATAGALTLNLTGLSSDANLTLLDSKGKVLKTSANKKSADETIVTALAAGDYLVKVAPADGGKGIVNNTYYNLSNYFQEETAGSSFATAVELTSGGAVHGWVGAGNKEDYYKFEVSADGATAMGDLSGFDSNVNLFVYNFKHKLVASSTKSGLTPESIDSGVGEVDAGIYYIKVMLAGAAATEYDLNFNLDQAISRQIIGAASPLAGSADTGLTGDPLKKSSGLLAG
ncbi:MAG: AIDA repeat-containing protein [Victivallaceae bacterium]